MRGVIVSILIPVLLGLVTVAAQLPPEIMADRYLVRVERLMAEKNHEAALEMMDKIIALQKEHNLTVPDEFHFKYAQIVLSAGLIQTAINSVNQYLAAAGRTGQFYREALELLDEAEQKQVEQEQPILPDMLVIPAGRFQMGCVSGIDCDQDEKPVHEVRLVSFELSKHEVTFEAYDRFTDATGRERVDDAGWGRGRRPVINVSWKDAVAYTVWLSDRSGDSYRLPSEAEWEYAARAGSTTKFHFGNDESQLCLYANHADANTDYEWRNTACSDGVGKRTATVGSYQPNAFGLHDMHGNVWEWVQDCWDDYYQRAPKDGSAPVDCHCMHRVLRGGSWGDSPSILRAADRVGTPAGAGQGSSGGFRVARLLTR